jgi:RNA recognition motif-containing protein
MNSKLFVGNLSFEVTENDLQDLFSGFGPVTDVNLMTDRSTGRSRGFAFVTMATPEGAQAAIQGAAGKDLKGRNLTVNEARPREERSGGGGGGNRGGYGDRRGGGGGSGGGGRSRPRY